MPAVREAAAQLHRAGFALVVVTNRTYYEYVRNRYHVPESRLFVVRNAPPLDLRSEISCDISLR